MKQLDLSERTGVIYRDDNLSRLPELADASIDLIYLDPPFFSNRHYEVIWNDESEVRSFEDRWKGGVEHYIEWMEPRLREMRRVLKRDGTLYLHCDQNASHYLKVMLDGIFGRKNFLNEIIWCYDTGGRSTRSFPRKHDTIFRYGKARKARFFYDQVALPRDPSTMHESIFTDEGGRKYQRNIKGGKEYRYYLDKGVLPNDWWTDIQALNPAAKERLGYPTQKPEALLARIIRASSARENTVLDPFCGCGTALAVAHKLQRHWIGMDISHKAIDVISERLSKLGASFSVVNGIESVDDLRSLGPLAFEDFIITRSYADAADAKENNMGIDAWAFMERVPMQIKQRNRVGRSVIDAFETAISRVGSTKGYIIAFSFSKDAYVEAARARSVGVEIALVEVRTLFEAGRDIAPRPAASQLEADLLHAVRLAANDPNRSRRAATRLPRRSMEEIEASLRRAG